MGIRPPPRGDGAVLESPVTTSEELLAESQKFDYEIMVFAGPMFSDLDLTVFGSAPTTTFSLNYSRLGQNAGLRGTAGYTETVIRAWPQCRGFDTYYVNPPGLPASLLPAAGWTDVSDRVHSLTMAQAGEPFSRLTYTIKGERYSASYFDKHQTILVAYRLRCVNAAGVWTNFSEWDLLFVGFVKNITHAEDYTYYGEFSLELGGISHLMDTNRVPPDSFGDEDIAKNKPVTVSSVLETPETLAGTGEFFGVNPSVVGDNIVNGDIGGPPWIAGGAPLSGTAELPPSKTFRDLIITEVYARPATGMNDDLYQWFEIFNPANSSININCADIVTLGRDGKYHLLQLKSNISGWNGWDDAANCKIPGRGFAILCYDKSRFMERWGQGLAVWVKEWRTMKGGADWHLNPDQGFIGIYWHYYGEESGSIDTAGPDWYGMRDGQKDAVVWCREDQLPSDESWFRSSHMGTGYEKDDLNLWWPQAGIPDEYGENQFGATSKWPVSLWDGIPLKANLQPDGYSYSKFVWVTTPGNERRYATPEDNILQWQLEPYPDPGHYKRPGMYEWAAIELGDLTCATDGTWTAGASTILLTTTAGLPDSGKFSIGGNIAEYSKLSTTKLSIVRWISGGTQDIGEGTPVYWYDGTAARSGYHIKRVQVYRKNGRPILQRARIYASEIHSPSYPDASEFPVYDVNEVQLPFDWEQDWTLIGNLGPTGIMESNGTLEYIYNNPSGTWFLDRNIIAYHLMVIVDQMEDNFYAAINELVVNAYYMFPVRVPPTAHPDVPGTDSNTSLSAILKSIICTSFGLPESMLYIEPSVDVPIVNQSISRTTVGKVLESLAKAYGFWIVETPGCRINILRNPWYAGGSAPEIWQWDADSIARLTPEPVVERRVSQVKVVAKDGAGLNSYIGVYPLEELATGDRVELTDIIAQNEAQAFAIAEAEFNRLTQGDPLEIQAVGPCTWVRPAMVHRALWYSNSSWPRFDSVLTITDPIEGYTLIGDARWQLKQGLLITGITHDIDFGQGLRSRNWITTLSGTATSFISRAA